RVSESVVLTIADQGPGIEAADRARVLDRFVRLEGSRSRPGSGLGLSLAAAVARMHGGAVELEDNQPGLRVRLTLPAADARPQLLAPADLVLNDRNARERPRRGAPTLRAGRSASPPRSTAPDLVDCRA